MKIQRFNSPTLPTSSQIESLSLVCDLLRTRRNKKVTTTLTLVEALGYVAAWQRVRWTGGVGSYQIMRGGIIRLLISATKSGLSGSQWHNVSLGPGMSQSFETPGKRFGFRYGWCIELKP